ncbi:MAG: hypothetical protein QXX17_06395 [Conexivisphaerales archaeon]
MSFSLAVFIASLWGLSSEMLEDAAVDFIYARIFGLKRLVISLLYSTALLASLTILLVLLFRTTLIAFLPFASTVSAVMIGAVGAYWLYFSFRGEGEDKIPEGKGGPFVLVFAEVLELFLILLPLSLTSYVEEAATSAVIAVAISIALAIILRRLLGDVIEERLNFKYLKLLSGAVLIFLSFVLFFGMG